tara:strand:- start:6944 stop:7210 length:267 start_codon:yes stop_codon:yes gene_type:complete
MREYGKIGECSIEQKVAHLQLFLFFFSTFARKKHLIICKKMLIFFLLKLFKSGLPIFKLFNEICKVMQFFFSYSHPTSLLSFCKADDL